MPDIDLTPLLAISTATITTQLFKKGIRSSYMKGPLPLVADQARIVGPAFTIRFTPAREDLATLASLQDGVSMQQAIEAIPPAAIAVVDAMGNTDCGIIGDIFARRMAERGVAGYVSDGAVRDVEGILASGLPVWCARPAAPLSIDGLVTAGWQQPVGCGRVTVIPDDVIVADRDGAVVIPKALVAEIIRDGAEQERFEAWVLGRVEAGASLPGLYPATAAAQAAYAADQGDG
ncbi:MAG: ribonuclease activity regulator RraA [Rhodospirillales bacterium]|nr:ribonuclease activity regulator RraA [Rhodospirillales bacterium]